MPEDGGSALRHSCEARALQFTSSHQTTSFIFFHTIIPIPVLAIIMRIFLALMICWAKALGIQATARWSRATSPRMGLSKGAQFPPDALEKFGVAGEPAVIFFFGQDDAPSCSKQIAAFDASFATFAKAGVNVVGIRSNAFSLTRYPVKSGSSKLSFIIDENDAVRKQIDIKADMLGFLGGRETYVVDAEGKVAAVHNAQLDVESHVAVALNAIKTL